MIETFPAEFISKLRNGKVVGIGTPLPAACLADLEDYAEQEHSATRVIGLRLARFPSHDQLLASCVRSIASGAVALWPDWYGADVNAGRTGKYSKEVSSLWLEKAKGLVSVGQLPLPTGYPNAIQVAQIALALGTPSLIIALAATEGTWGMRELKSLVATATWLATQSQAKIALLVPQNLAGSEEFDRVIEESIGYLHVVPETEPTIEELPVVTVTSINGRPNPTSPGEMLLAARLAKNPELAGLFFFNQPVKSVHGKEYKVDLLWPAGKLVVEVDGYSFHSSSFAFGQDRHRDYELLISGYRVLRLTHEKISKILQGQWRKFVTPFISLTTIPLMALNLSPKQALAIYYLAFTGKEPMQSQLPIKLTASEKKELLNANLFNLTKRPPARGAFLSLGEVGWKWVGENLGCDLGKSQISSEILQGLTHHLGEFLKRSNIPLAELIFPRKDVSRDPAVEIHAAYMRLAEDQLNRPVRISDLANALPDLAPSDLLELLINLQKAKQVFFSRGDDPQSVTDEDRSLSVRINNADMHLAAFTS